MYTFHVVNLPHTQTTKEYLSCAYTQKVLNFCKMMKGLGHKVYLYASEDNEAPCDELITLLTKEEQKQLFGENDFKKNFYNIEWKGNEPYWIISNNRAIEEIAKRSSKKDFVCLIGGYCQKPIADMLTDMMCVEFGVGYPGVFSKYKVFESYSFMHEVYGIQRIANGQNYDAVIPNYFDPLDFPSYDGPKEDYYLFIGRMVSRKGPHIAAEATGKAGVKLIMAGQGVVEIKDDGTIVSKELEIKADHVKHVGSVGVEERAKLMSRAKAVLVPTQYLEPFGGVAVEAMMAGTPVITTDYGAFTETVQHGVTGYRTRTLGEIVWAIKNVDKLDPKLIREYAIKNYSIDRVKELYQAYFERLYTLWEDGWYSELDSGVSKYNSYGKYYV